MVGCAGLVPRGWRTMKISGQFIVGEIVGISTFDCSTRSSSYDPSTSAAARSQVGKEWNVRKETIQHLRTERELGRLALRAVNPVS